MRQLKITNSGNHKWDSLKLVPFIAIGLTSAFRCYKLLNRLITVSCLSFLLFTLENCKKKHEDPRPLTELEKLPAATQVGKGTFGCLVNGKAMIAPDESYTSSFYQQGILEISSRTLVIPDIPSLGLNIDLAENGYLLQETDYPLTPPPYYTVSFGSIENGRPLCIYEIASTISGKATITKFDHKNYVVAGLFEFTTYLAGCDTVKVTDGRFDLRYAS